MNRDGAEFRRNGYRAPGEAGVAPRVLPFSLIATFGATAWRADTAAAPGGRARSSETAFEQQALELHSAGTLARNVSYHASVAADGDRGTIRAGETFVQLDDLARGGALNLRAGVFDVELPFLSNARRTTVRRYLAPVTLDAHGLELNDARPGWTYGTGLINSQRAATSLSPGGRALNRLEDKYLWVVRDAGEAQLAARMLFGRQDSNLPSLPWMQHLQATAGASLALQRMLLTTAYVLDRFDDRPAAGIHQRHQYTLLEALVPLESAQRWALTARIEHDCTTKTVLTREEDRNLEVVNVGCFTSPNTRIEVEVAHGGDNVGGPRVDEVSAGVQISY